MPTLFSQLDTEVLERILGHEHRIEGFAQPCQVLLEPLIILELLLCGLNQGSKKKIGERAAAISRPSSPFPPVQVPIDRRSS